MAALCDDKAATADERRASSSAEITMEEVRPYFSELSCNLRVLGSQLRLEPYELDDLCLHDKHSQGDPRQRLLEECFKKEKITSWKQFVSVLEKTALDQVAVADRIKAKYRFETQSDSEATTSSMFAPLQSPASSITSDPSSMEIHETESALNEAVKRKSDKPDTCRTKKVVKSGQITDHDRLFNDISIKICDKYTEVGIELGLKGEVLTDELETGIFKMEKGSKKALKMLQLWQQSVDKDDCTYSVLASALEKHGFQRCAHKYCYTVTKSICIEMDLPDAVNVIMKVTNQDLPQLGNCLGLDPVRVQEITSHYDLDEQHQRLVELWFKREANPTWEMLQDSLLSLEQRKGTTSPSTVSMSSVPITPTSPKDLMFRSNEREIESRFGCLLIEVQKALKSSNVKVEDVRQLLVSMFRRDDCIPKTNLDDIFTAVTVNNLWSYEDHYPVEKVIKQLIPDKMTLMNKYKGHLSGFDTATSLIEYMMNKNIPDDIDDEEMETSELALTKKHFRTLKVRLNVGRKISEMSMIYVRDLWISLANEFDIPSLTAVVDKILEGSLEIVWLILPHVAEMIATSAHKSTSFFRQHDIVYVAIDDHVIYSDQLMEERALALNTDNSTMEVSESLGEDNTAMETLSQDDTPTHTSESRAGPLVPSSPPQPSTYYDTEFQIESFKTRFAELQARTKDELKSMKRTVGTVNVKLLKALPARTEKEYNKYVKLKRSGKQSNLDELFEDLDDFCWNFLEYDLLQFVINSNNCHAVLKNAMDQYAREVEYFKHCTTASSFIKQGQPLIMKKSLKRGYRRLKTKHAVNPDEFVIADIDRFRKDVWSSDVNLSDCPFHLFSISSGSVQVELAIPEEFSYPLVTFFCSEEGKELLLKHHIYEIFIDDEPINPSLFLVEAAACENWSDVDSLLQDKEGDIDPNYTNQDNGWTALFFLAANGMAELVQKMLFLGANPNIRDIDGQTPLMVAVARGHLEVVEVFLKEQTHQCQVNLQENVHGRSVLHIAAEQGFTDIFEFLSDPTYEVDTTLKDKDRKTALQIAEEKELTTSDTVATEKEHGTDSEGGETAHRQRKGWLKKLSDWWDRNRREIRLTRAVISGSLADVQKALDNGANPNRIINRMTQRTPLLEACQRGHTEVARLLLSRGANPNWRATDDWNALVLASRNGHVETVELLLSWDPSCREIINVKAGYYGWTPLHTTCYYNSYELVFMKDEFLKRLERVAELLLDNGADATITDRHSETPLTYASDKGYAAIAEVIIQKTPKEKREALLNYQKKDSWSSLLLASKQGHSKVVRSLLDAGASMTVTNKDKMTALHVGVTGGHVEVVEELASRADPSAINAVDKHGLTPLILATKLKNVKLIEVLHENGADVNAKTKEDKTALMYAAKLNSIHVINLLLQYKADLFAKDSNQQTARTLATDKEVQKHIDKLIKERQKQLLMSTQSDYTIA